MYQSKLSDQWQKYESSSALDSYRKTEIEKYRNREIEKYKYNVCRTGHGSLTYPPTANVSEDMSDQLQKCQKSDHISFQLISKGLYLSAFSYLTDHWSCIRDFLIVS